jgi:hypothetical protein
MRRPAVLLLLAAPLALAACGGGGGNSSSSGVQLTPTAYVAQAAKKSAQAPSEHVHLTATAKAQGQQVSIDASGDFDNESKVGAMTAHANLQGLDMQIDEVLDGTTVYLRSPLIEASLPKGKTWMKVDLAKLGASQGIDFSSLIGQSPVQSFSQLRATGEAKKIGDETIGDTETTHYRGRIDLAKLPQGAKLAQTTGVRYGPYDVWVGKDDGYVRRLTSSYALHQQSVALTMNFSDFGKDVSVDVPPAAETVDGSTGIDSIGG